MFEHLVTLQVRRSLAGTGTATPFTIFRGPVGQFLDGFPGPLIAVQDPFAQNPGGGILLQFWVSRDCRGFFGSTNAFAHRLAVIMACNLGKLGKRFRP